MRRVKWPLLVLNGVGLGYVGLFAYLGFAAGVATTLRAAILAYILAVVLGLCWIGLLQLQVGRRTYPVFGAVIAGVSGAVAVAIHGPETGVCAGRRSERQDRCYPRHAANA